ncbi:MAG: DHH family phosphoesterase, partial [Tyzzerella sp.]|nr:DHH family phosphoesterase [Tyzzerella sp.]
MKNNDVHLKGQLKMYMQWPLIMSALLIAMNIWIYKEDKKAAGIMFVFVLIYIAVAWGLYSYNRSLILADMIQFSVQYQKMQNQFLKELSVPYALLMETGRVLWKNDSFEALFENQKKEKYIDKIIPELNCGVYPKPDFEHSEINIQYNGRDYRATMRKVSVEGFSELEPIVNIHPEKEYFIALSLTDVTELNEYIRENEAQRLVVGLIYIDNYDEIMESVEEVRQSLLVALIDRKVNKYFGDVDGIVKKLEKDRYFIVMRQESYLKCKENRFALLEEVKQVNIGNSQSATLSIGIGLSNKTYTQNYNHARTAIDLALARGGDQAV